VPFTELQAPINKSVYVNVYVSGEDMQFNRYDPLLLPQIRQGFTESGSEEQGVDVSVPYTCLELNPSSSNSNGTSDFCFGEQPVSLRSLLKRYTNFATASPTVSAGAHLVVSYARPIIPSVSPLYSNAGSADTAPTLLRTMLYAYLGVKGGMRRRIRHAVTGESIGYMNAAQVTLSTAESSFNSGVVTPVYGSSIIRIRGLGSATFVPHTNAGIEVELPYYSPNLFHFAFSETGNGTTDAGEMAASWCRNFTIAFESSAVAGTLMYTEEYATAEDFNLMRYNGAPYHTVAH